ncbi:MAG: V-type ATP synthase subunit F [Candidatus Woesearchaeota archaeon]|nr:V-type ATP synthase subunit F [Candidatus Woesearchaeota archaeon]MDP7323340.1 V-type ATP synthase subunit F [Candidatus Woesearchaeota archaeon]MDP7457349.1 V-type ATP synthase subunit F [Candidatus Woesearchaeota archaeon]
MDVAVAGGHGFTLGFRLAGIRKVVDVKSGEDVEKLLKSEQVGIVIMDQETYNGLSEDLKESVVGSIKPIFVVVSDKPQEELRKMIIRSIGVDLLREER